MLKMTNCGITIDVPQNDVSFYLRAGYKKVEEEPVTNPASEPSTSEPEEKTRRGRHAAAPSNTELPMVPIGENSDPNQSEGEGAK